MQRLLSVADQIYFNVKFSVSIDSICVNVIRSEIGELFRADVTLLKNYPNSYLRCARLVTLEKL